MSQHNKKQVCTCPQCGSYGNLEEVQRRTYFPPITIQQLLSKLLIAQFAKTWMERQKE